jgi:hypothetical protein
VVCTILVQDPPSDIDLSPEAAAEFELDGPPPPWPSATPRWPVDHDVEVVVHMVAKLHVHRHWEAVLPGKQMALEVHPEIGMFVRGGGMCGVTSQNVHGREGATALLNRM